MTAAERNRARYAALKAARQCVYCAAGLQEGDGITCVECTERKAESRARYEASAKGRAAERRHQRKKLARRMANGQCLSCTRPAGPGRRRCDHHLTYQAAAQAVYLDRREQAA